METATRNKETVHKSFESVMSSADSIQSHYVVSHSFCIALHLSLVHDVIAAVLRKKLYSANSLSPISGEPLNCRTRTISAAIQIMTISPALYFVHYHPIGVIINFIIETQIAFRLFLAIQRHSDEPKIMGNRLSRMLIIGAVVQDRVSAACKCIPLPVGSRDSLSDRIMDDTATKCGSNRIIIEHPAKPAKDEPHESNEEGIEKAQKEKTLQYLTKDKCWKKIPDETQDSIGDEFWGLDNTDIELRWKTGWAPHCPSKTAMAKNGEYGRYETCPVPKREEQKEREGRGAGGDERQGGGEGDDRNRPSEDPLKSLCIAANGLCREMGKLN